VSSILRFEIGSCAGFSSANAPHHDHSFGIVELIEVKAGRICASWGTTFRKPDRRLVQQQNGPIGRHSLLNAGECSGSGAGRLNLATTAFNQPPSGMVHGSAILRQLITAMTRCRTSEGPASGAGLLCQSIGAGLPVSPQQRRAKRNEHGDDGYGNEQRINWHGWSPAVVCRECPRHAVSVLTQIKFFRRRSACCFRPRPEPRRGRCPAGGHRR
jgi:hypothetical protein